MNNTDIKMVIKKMNEKMKNLDSKVFYVTKIKNKPFLIIIENIKNQAVKEMITMQIGTFVEEHLVDKIDNKFFFNDKKIVKELELFLPNSVFFRKKISIFKLGIKPVKGRYENISNLIHIQFLIRLFNKLIIERYILSELPNR